MSPGHLSAWLARRCGGLLPAKDSHSADLENGPTWWVAAHGGASQSVLPDSRVALKLKTSGSSTYGSDTTNNLAKCPARTPP